MKKFKVLALFFGLLLCVGAMAQERVKVADPIIVFGNNVEEGTARAQQLPVDIVGSTLSGFSLAKTPEELKAMATPASQEAEDPRIESSEDSENQPEGQKVTIVVPSRPGTVFSLEIAGVEFSLAIEPAIYRNPYLYPYGLWSYGWYGWHPYWRSYGSYYWRWYLWDYGWGPYAGFGKNPYRDRNRIPVHRDQLKDLRRTSTTPTLLASNINPSRPASTQANNQVKSYPSNTKQKFDGRISAKYANAKPNPLVRNSSTTTSRAALRPASRATTNPRTNFTSSRLASNRNLLTLRASNQSRSTNSRAVFRPASRSNGSSRISTPARSSAPRSTAVRSSGASRSSAARTTAPRASSSRGGAVRRK